MNQLQMGMQHEGKEHADVTHGDKEMVKKLTLPHLKEDPKYYTHLHAMEDAVKKKESIKKAIERVK